MVSDNRDTWEQLAPWWDELAGEEGDEFHRRVVRPTVLDLLDLRPGERVLEIGCGNGGFARQLARLGVDVVATDQAVSFIRVAGSRAGPSVDYRVVDATDPVQLASLGAGTYDAAVANMVLMDMPEIGPLYRALTELLRPGGRFVFAVIHPCFGYGSVAAPAAQADRSVRAHLLTQAFSTMQRLNAAIPWRLRQKVVERAGAMLAGLASLRYLKARQILVRARPDQPVAHSIFHRPLTGLLNPAFDAGLCLDRIAEPPFGKRDAAQASLLAVRLIRSVGGGTTA